MRGFFAALVLYVICSAFHFKFSEISLLLLWFVIKQQQQHAECVLKLRLTVWVALAFRLFDGVIGGLRVWGNSTWPLLNECDNKGESDTADRQSKLFRVLFNRK